MKKTICVLILLVIIFIEIIISVPFKSKAVKSDLSYISPYTGEAIDKAAYDNIPFMCVIENSKDARPQSGLSEADIVFETLVEGGIPRFIALFHKNSPAELGPVRSVRPYFLDIAESFNLPFAHCGGSPKALDRIANNKLLSLNEISYGNYYWRDNNRKLPHNLYTSADKLRKLIKDKNYIRLPKTNMKFNPSYWNNSKGLNPANNINIKLNSYYKTYYVYKNSVYYKFMDNTQAVDKINSNPISFKNIIVEITDIKLDDDNNRLNINLIGHGNGYIISSGKYLNMTWEKKSINSNTTFKDSQGNTIPLNVGNTCIHIIDKNSEVQIK